MKIKIIVGIFKFNINKEIGGWHMTYSLTSLGFYKWRKSMD